jgi:amidase
VDAINWTLAEMGRTMTAPQYLFTIDWLHGYGRRMASWWQSGFDLLLTPTLTEPPPALGTFAPAPEDPTAAGMRAQQFASFTLPFNMTGQPAISLPLHWTEGGLPVGIQLVAAYGREDLLLQAGAQLERARGWSERRPRVRA